MTLQFDAVYENGVLRPKEPLALANGTEVRVAIDTADPTMDPLVSVIGIADGPASGDSADAHDDYIYGKQQS